MGWDPVLCQKYVEMLIRHDEMDRALLVLENIPAQYRMEPPDNLKQLKGDILAASFTSYRYSICEVDAKCQEELPDDMLIQFMDMHIRTRLLRDQVKMMNENGIAPHIVDFGPGPYHMPRALMKMGMDFTYWDLPLNHESKKKALPKLEPILNPDRGMKVATIFLGLEIIEHLHHEEDLAIEAIRNCGRWPEIVMLSTPYCTFRVLPDDLDWRKFQLQHLRAYTPEEFQRAAKRIFPPYVWSFHYHEKIGMDPMSLVGTRFDLVKNVQKV